MSWRSRRTSNYSCLPSPFPPLLKTPQHLVSAEPFHPSGHANAPPPEACLQPHKLLKLSSDSNDARNPRRPETHVLAFALHLAGGGEASGKSTQIELLAERLRHLGHRILVTREPGGTPLGESIRFLLKHAPEGRGMNSHTELLLFLASRAALVRDVIVPALAEGTWILSDRFLDSTTVYQGAGRLLPVEIVERLNAFAVGPNLPGLTLVLDLDPAEARRRLARRPKPGGQSDRMEDQPPDFFERVREGYHQVAHQHPQRVKIVPANGTIDETSQAIWQEVAATFHL